MPVRYRSIVFFALLLAANLAVLRFAAPKLPQGAEFEFRIPVLLSVAAACALILLAGNIRSLLPLGAGIWPSAFIGPLLHAMLMALIASLGTTAPVAIERTPDAVQPAMIWLDVRLLAYSVGAQCLSISVLFWLVDKLANLKSRAGRI